MKHGVVLIRFNHSRFHSLLRNTLRLGRIDIAHTHGNAKLHGMYKLTPFGNVTVIQVFQFAESLGRQVFVFLQHFIRFFQFFQHLCIYLLLRIVSDSQVFTRIIIIHHLRIRNRTVNVRHTMHDTHPENFTES